MYLYNVSTSENEFEVITEPQVESFEFAEGRAEGEAKAKLAMAKMLLEQGVDFEIIAKTTGLTEEEILEN